MRRLGSVLGLAGLVVVSCLVPDLELVRELPGAAGSADAAGAAAGGKSSNGKGGSSANAGAQHADAGMDAGGAAATDGGAPPTNAGASAGGDGNAPLDDSAPSCTALSKTACQGESCCTKLPAPGCIDCDGTDGKYTVSPLALDKYEVTVGRFRAFVEAYTGPPAIGAGAHPQIASSGWLADWNGNMPTGSAAFANAMEFRECKLLAVRTWTSEPGENEQKPANCLTWYEAFAFCAWDGGFLPSELDWQAAATGGRENRMYAWAGTTLDTEHALYGSCGNGVSATCDLSSILEVGSKPAGAGKWGHLDLIGSVWEWLLDSPNDSKLPPAQPCTDCASLGVSNYRSIRGGSWPEDASYQSSTRRVSDPADSAWYNVGIRCAHAP
ncbi:MAG TPA: formylglycine-generating enzyme family protein [Polyangiaceae bacterium]|nr:formylglycine-generating enzyme family protein [Polyangiaceae bacterium]